jgi:hypothetical protein
VPPDDRLWLDDHDPVKTAGPQTIEQNPEGPVQPRQPGAGPATVSKNLQLVAKSHHLELQVEACPQAGKKAMNDGNDDTASRPILALGWIATAAMGVAAVGMFIPG